MPDYPTLIPKTSTLTPETLPGGGIHPNTQNDPTYTIQNEEMKIGGRSIESPAARRLAELIGPEKLSESLHGTRHPG